MQLLKCGLSIHCPYTFRSAGRTVSADQLNNDLSVYVSRKKTAEKSLFQFSIVQCLPFKLHSFECQQTSSSSIIGTFLLFHFGFSKQRPNRNEIFQQSFVSRIEKKTHISTFSADRVIFFLLRFFSRLHSS